MSKTKDKKQVLSEEEWENFVGKYIPYVTTVGKLPVVNPNYLLKGVIELVQKKVQEERIKNFDRQFGEMNQQERMTLAAQVVGMNAYKICRETDATNLNVEVQSSKGTIKIGFKLNSNNKTK